MTVDETAVAVFESGATENGTRWWSARWLQERLGYATWRSFRACLGRAMQSCTALGLDTLENFEPYRRESNDEDFRLSRFACFLVANHADGKKPAVAQAKAYLASIAAAAAEDYAAMLERIGEREELSRWESQMSAVARRAGVIDSYDMGIFKNSGYLGMYNMTLQRLKTYKGLHDPKGSKTLYDYMGATELAANSFRVTQTAERIKRNQARGVDEASAIARSVGEQVRAMMMSDGGTPPENLELEQHIRKDRSALKKTSRQMAKLDKSPKQG